MTEALEALDRTARAAVAARDWGAAAAAFEALAGRLPDNPRPWYSLALARARAGAGVDPVPALRRCLALALE